MTRRAYRLGYCYRCAYVWRLRRRVPMMCARCKSRKFGQPKVLIPEYGGGLGIDEVITPHRRQVDRICARYRATLAVFGSVARHAATERSDVDLLVYWNRAATPFDRMDLASELGRALGRRVDLMTEESLHWLVKPQVLHEMVPL